MDKTPSLDEWTDYYDQEEAHLEPDDEQPPDQWWPKYVGKHRA